MSMQDQNQYTGPTVRRKKAVIIGGGLAGMTVAKELLKHGLEVVILEVTGRLGGKAGADKRKRKEVYTRAAKKTGGDEEEVYEEHGYHIFPSWYANTRQLLEDLGIADNLVDLPNFHMLKKREWRKGAAPTLSTLYPISSPWHLIQDIQALARLLSLPEAILTFYAILDLGSASYDNRAALDRVTVNGFFHSRFYATEALADFQSNSVLQATSVPTYEMSAMTLRKATNLWFTGDLYSWEWLPSSLLSMPQWLSSLMSNMQKGWLVEAQDQRALHFPQRYVLQPLPQEAEPSPQRLRHKVYSVLNGNLQQKFINPFTAYLQKPPRGTKGADIRTHCRVMELVITEGRVTRVKIKTKVPEDQQKSSHEEKERWVWEKDEEGDIFVLATPPEVTVKLLGKEVYEAEQNNSDVSSKRKLLSEVTHLETAPMAALHLYLRNGIKNMPAGHVVLFNSRYGLSLIDVSQIWTDCTAIKPYKTVLSVIASDFKPLAVLLKEQSKEALKEEDISEETKKEMARELIKELQEYIPLDERDIENSEWTIKPNLDSPLFLNTVGSWHFRPGTRTRIDNLYTAGDYCRSAVDLTTMESAVMSGLSTARDILKSERITAKVKIQPLKMIPRNQLLFLKYSLFPSIILLNFGQRVWDSVVKTRAGAR